MPVGTDPTWATDTNFASGDEAGLSTKVEPSSGQIAQGDVSGLAAPSVWSNWWKNKVGAWILYLKGIKTDAEFLGHLFQWTNTHEFGAGLSADGVNVTTGNSLVLEGDAETNFDAPRAYTVRRAMTGHGTEGPDATTRPAQKGGVILTQEPGSSLGFTYHQPIELPQDAEITGWRALVTAVGGGATLTAQLFRVEHTFGGSPALDTGTAVGASDTSTSGALDTLAISGLSETVDNTVNQYVLVFSDPVTPGGGAIDMQIHGYELTYEMPGLRNG
jgi:hypothetical protein